MTEKMNAPLDENTRRYYLEAMGVQCWESIDTVDSAQEVINDIVRDVVALENDSTKKDSVTLKSLEQTVQQCKKCQLHEFRVQATKQAKKQAILGRGNSDADVMIVLLSPKLSSKSSLKAGDDEPGQLCSGEAYELLSKMLSAINIVVNDVYITSLLKCNVPDTHTISASEIRHCNNYLQQQIKLVQPKALFVLGDTASRCILQKDVALDVLREEINGSDSKSNSLTYEGIPLFVSYSPEELLERPENKRKAWLDLQKMQRFIQKTNVD